MTWDIYEFIISQSAYISCAVYAQQRAILTEGSARRPETTTTPRGLCFNLSLTLEVDDIIWHTCRGGEERGREKERRRAVIHQQWKKGEKGGYRDGTLFSSPAGPSLPVGWDRLLWWGSQLDIWWDTGDEGGSGHSCMSQGVLNATEWNDFTRKWE